MCTQKGQSRQGSCSDWPGLWVRKQEFESLKWLEGLELMGCGFLGAWGCIRAPGTERLRDHGFWRVGFESPVLMGAGCRN